MFTDLPDLIQATSRARGSSSAPAEAPPLASFKAGKIDLQFDAHKGVFQCEPNTTRGEIRLVWKDSKLVWQWFDRRHQKVVDSFDVSDYENSTFQRVDVPTNQKEDRIFLWTQKPGKYLMYWAQDQSDENDDDFVAKVNELLDDPQSAAPEGTTPSTTNHARNDAENTGGATPNDSNNTSNQAQIDALSNILQNLGMPPSGSSSGSGDSANRQLTLQDLQAAMGSVTQPSQATPPLTEIVSPEAISGLLRNQEICNRLMELLPEEQRSMQHLEENLRSPQVHQTLRSLTQALLPDDTGNMDGFYSVLANFSLDPADGQDAMAQNNPIQAFLDALLAKVERERQEEENKQEE